MPVFIPPRFPLALAVAGLTGLTACSTVDGASNRLVNAITPYKIDVVQGNFVSRQQLQALQPGMRRGQVKSILGTPLLASIFHADRWDYAFTFKRQGIAPQARRVSVFFKDDVLTRIEADELPTEEEFVASLDSGRPTGPVPNLQAPEDPSTPLAAVAPIPAASAAALPLNTAYPPLEPLGR